MIYIWCAIAAAISSIITVILLNTKQAYGTLRIDHSNPNKDIYRIDIDDLDKISRKTRILLKVDNNADLSQK